MHSVNFLFINKSKTTNSLYVDIFALILYFSSTLEMLNLISAVTKTTHPSVKHLSSAKDFEPINGRRGGSSFLQKLRIGKYNRKPDQAAHAKTTSKEISSSQESKCLPSLSDEVASPQKIWIKRQANVARSAPNEIGKLSKISEIDKSHQACVSSNTLPDDIENKTLQKP